MGNFKILVLFIALASIIASSSNASAYPFLTKSKLLKQLGAQILISEDQGDAIVFDKGILKEHNVPLDGRETYLITSNGLVPMEGRTITKDLMQMCDNPYPGIGFKKTNGEGIFIATGKNLEGSINWYPAKTTDKHNSNCFEGHPLKNPKYSSYSSTLPKGTIRQARWERKLTKEEIETNCKEMAEINSRNKQQSLDDDYVEKCLKREWICKDEERLIVAFETDGICKEITNSSIDCWGKSLTGEDLREFLGTIEIIKGTQREVWLIWNAPGYEGEGVYTIEINDIGKKEKPSEEWLVYNGC